MHTLRINVLGPVEVLVDGVAVTVGRPKQRLLLAVLLSRHGAMVAVDELAVALWGDEPPRSAAGNLRSYVHGLRQVLGADALPGNGRPGYRLATERLTVDATEFLALADEGRHCDDPATAARLLHRALGLWRGRPFADLGDVPALAVETARLEEARLLAVERRVEADLRTGDAAGLVGELTALVAAHPHRERFVEQLMLALYRSGRQVDALAVYRQTQATLWQDLGVEPGAALADRQRAILRRDPHLDHPEKPAEPPPPTAGPAKSPAHLPRDVPGFAGRTAELTWLDQTLGDGGLALLLGTAGVGKTALAVHWAHRVRDRFPDGQLYVNLRGFDPSGPAVPPAEAAHLLLEALDVPPAQIPHTLPARTALYRTLLADRRMLIVLDNARDAKQVRAVLPGAGRCQVVVTSRHRLTGLIAIDDARPLALGLLNDTDALDLLRRRLDPDRVDEDLDAAAEIVARCARLPLALVIVAARAATGPDLSLAAVLADLRAGGDRLGAFADDDAMSDVRSVFSWSYRALSPAAARLFRLVGLVFAAEFSAAAAASLAGLPVGPARSILAELARAHLLTEKAPGRYTVHDLLRAYAAELAAGADTDSVAALDRLIDHYLHTAHRAAMLLNPHRDPIALDPPRDGTTVTRFPDADAAMTWFEAEYRVLLAIPDHPAMARATVWRLAWTTWDFFNRRGYWADWVTLQEAALDTAVDDEGRACAHRGLTLAYGPLGRHRDVEKHLHQALHLFEALGDDLGRAHTHFTFSWLYEQDGADEAAVDQAERALRLFESAGHRFGQAHTLNAVGWRNAQLGRYELTLTHCQRALVLLEDLGDRYGQAAALDSLGFAYHCLGRYPSAVARFERAVGLFREIGDRFNEAQTLTRLGDSHRAAGSDTAAGAAWRVALELFEELDHAGAADVRKRLS